MWKVLDDDIKRIDMYHRLQKPNGKTGDRPCVLTTTHFGTTEPLPGPQISALVCRSLKPGKYSGHNCYTGVRKLRLLLGSVLWRRT